MSELTSVFASYQAKAYPYRFQGHLQIEQICGGIPTDDKVAEGWLRSRVQESDDMIREMVAEVMVQRSAERAKTGQQISPDEALDEAIKEVDTRKHLNGFKRDYDRGGELYIEGRQLKAAIKEAASVSVGSGKLDKGGWGKTNKGLLSFVAEHIFVVQNKLYLGVAKPTGINQRFIHTFHGSGIQYEEYVLDAQLDFTAITDWNFNPEQWAMIWLTAQNLGLGASRTQGYGKFTCTEWEQVESPNGTPSQK